MKEEWVTTREAARILGMKTREGAAACLREFPLLRKRNSGSGAAGRPEFEWDRQQIQAISALRGVLDCPPRTAANVYCAALSGALYQAMNDQ